MRRQHLDRYEAVNFFLIALIDGRHAALAEQLDNLVFIAKILPD
jgi:hypothetical protein